MVWLWKKAELKDGECEERQFFCLWPRRTEDGVVVWLENVMATRKWNKGPGYAYFSSTTYHASDCQKAAVGLKW